MFQLVLPILSASFLFIPNIPIVYAATPISSIYVTPGSTTISATTTEKVSFVTTSNIPVNGKIKFTFPSGFVVGSAAFSAWSGIDGGESVTSSGQTVTVTRDGTGTTSTPSGAMYITLANIGNSSSTNTTYAVTVETDNSSGTTIDGPSTSFNLSLCTNDCLSGLSAIPWLSTAATSTKYTINFTTASALTATGTVNLTFPTGFNVSGATFATSTGFTGNWTNSINGQTVSLTRDGTGSSASAGAKSIILSSITNNSSASSNYYINLETDNGSTNVEGPVAIRFSIVSSGLGLSTVSPWPAVDQNEKRNRRSPNTIPTYPAIEWKNIAVSSTLNLIGINGEIYAVGQVGNHPVLYAINTDGTTKWTYAFPDLGSTSSLYAGAIDENGTIYLSYVLNSGPNVDAIYAINENGSLKWISHDNADQFDGYAGFLDLASDGSIIIKGMPHTCSTIYSGDGLEKALKCLGAWMWWSRVGIGPDNSIYLPVNGGPLYVLNPDGSINWTYSSSTANFFHSVPSLDNDRTLYFVASVASLAHLEAINSSNGSLVWDTTIPSGASDTNGSVSIGKNILVVNSSYLDQVYIMNKDGSLLNTIIDSTSTDAIHKSGVTLDANDNLLYWTDDERLVSRDSSGNLKWMVYQTDSPSRPNSIVPGSPILSNNQKVYTNDYTNGGFFSIKPWTLTASIATSTYTGNQTINFTATTSMLHTYPVTGEANKVQAYLDDGTRVPLSYSSSDRNGNTIWTGSYTIPSVTASGNHTVTIEAVAVDVATTNTVHFASAATNSGNTGITTNVNYTIKPSSFDLSSPANNATQPNGSVVFSWNSSTNASSYNLYIDNNLVINTSNNSSNQNLSCGGHTWYVVSTDGISNVNSNSTYNLNINCPPVIIGVNGGAASIPTYQVSPVTNITSTAATSATQVSNRVSSNASIQAQITVLLAQIQLIVAQLKAVGIEVNLPAGIILPSMTKFTKDLGFEMRSDEVKALQKELAKDKDVYPQGIITRYFGSLTKLAVQEFQKKYGLPTTGFVGPRTRDELNKLFRK